MIILSACLPATERLSASTASSQLELKLQQMNQKACKCTGYMHGQHSPVFA